MPEDELTAVASSALQHLSHHSKANFLLDTALTLIDAGQYGEQVERYLEVYLKTPNLSKENIARAVLARGNARKAAGDRLILQANQDFQTVLNLEPSNRTALSHLSRYQVLQARPSLPASNRAPLEVWDRIAYHIPRYHLRTWLSLSSFHHSIASRRIFHTIDIYFGEDTENLNRGLDIFDRAKNDPLFAQQVKCLRLHWAYEEGDMLDLMARIFRTALPEFKHLQEFEWIGYPEMRADMVQTVLKTHSQIRCLGLIGWHFDAVGVSSFRNLSKFTLRAEDDDGFADMGEVRTVLDQNIHTLKHLILGAYLARHHSWDHAFQSTTINNLTHLDLVDTRISHFVLARIAHASNLESLTLHGTFEEPGSAKVVFGSDHMQSDGENTHTLLPNLTAFRFLMVGHDDELGLYESVTRFLRKRRQLRRLDLGNCPWEMVRDIVGDLEGLRVLGIRIANATSEGVRELINKIPEVMGAIRLTTVVSDVALDEHARAFARFPSLSVLHLQSPSKRPKPNMMSDKDFQLQTDIWTAGARNVAATIKSLDFVGWNGEHYVVVRDDDPQHGSHVDLKELPARRRLDCGKGVDLGTDDATWLERKDVPMDYEMPGLE